MRAVECFSAYSLMSKRTRLVSSSNKNSANDLASSVLPTPVGPKSRNEPSGRVVSCRPARARRTACAMASTAWRCPMTRAPMRSSICNSFSRSVSSNRVAGMPVQRLTTRAISSASTASGSKAPAACAAWSFSTLASRLA